MSTSQLDMPTLATDQGVRGKHSVAADPGLSAGVIMEHILIPAWGESQKQVLHKKVDCGKIFFIVQENMSISSQPHVHMHGGRKREGPEETQAAHAETLDWDSNISPRRELTDQGTEISEKFDRAKFSPCFGVKVPH